MFSTPDSETYRDVSRWIFYGIPTESTKIRPFLYPLIIGIFEWLAGIGGIWIFQALCWLFCLNFLRDTVYRISENSIVALIVSLIVAANLPFIALTMFGLTEVVTCLLLSTLLWAAVRFLTTIGNSAYFIRIIFILVLLTVVKPLFFPLLVTLIVVLFPFYARKLARSPARVLLLLLALSPLFFQMGLMKSRHGEFTVSQISGKTFREYLVAQTVAFTQNVSREESLSIARNLSTPEIKEHLKNNKEAYYHVFAENIRDNTITGSNYVCLPVGSVCANFNYSYESNKTYAFFHRIMFVPFLICLVLLIAGKNYDKLLLLVLAGGTSYFILITSGISAFQLDRLVFPTIVLWPVAYTLILCQALKPLVRVLKKKVPHNF